MTQKKLRLSYSRLTTYMTCHKMYYWTYIENLIPAGPTDIPLQVGGTVHELRDLWVSGKLDTTLMKDPEEFKKFIQDLYPEGSQDNLGEVAFDSYRLFKLYMEENQDVKHVASETHLEWDDGEKIWYTRLDGLVRTEDNRLWREELKTTGRMDSAYLSGLRGGLQAGMAYTIMKNVMPEAVTGTFYVLLVKTKIAQHHRMFIPAERQLYDMTEKCVNGIYQGIKNEIWYPSMNCFFYNRECKYLPLCKNDSPQIRKDFYKERVDFLEPAGSDTSVVA